jgi:chromosome segregation ATPase
VVRLSEEKARMAAKMNSFDIDALLLKENSAVSRKELEILRNENEQLQALIESNCCQIEDLEAAMEAQTADKDKLESKLREATRELDGMRREFRMTIEASKHSKPKRESSAKNIKEMPIE